MESDVVTHWNSKHKESRRDSINEKDYQVALDQMISPHGIDNELCQANRNKLNNVRPTQQHWLIYQQYEGAAQAIRQYSEFIQSSQVIVHLELFEGRMAVERLSAPFCTMYKNLSFVDDARSCDLTKRLCNQLMAAED